MYSTLKIAKEPYGHRPAGEGGGSGHRPAGEEGGGGGHRPAGVGGQLSACCTKSVGTVCTPTYTIVFTNTRENSNKYLITANIFSIYSTGILADFY